MANLRESTPQKKMYLPPSATTHCPYRSSGIGGTPWTSPPATVKGSQSSGRSDSSWAPCLHDRMSIAPISCGYCSGNHSCPEFKSAAATSYQDDCVPQHFTHASNSYILLSFSSIMFLKSWRWWYECLNYGWTFNSHVFSALWLIMSLCIGCCPLQ